MSTEERRRFFRIDDEVNLFYKKIDKKMLTESSSSSDSILSNCSLSAALQMASQETPLLMYRLEKNFPDVADYIKVLETKIEFLSQAITMQTGKFTENNTRNANISATGIAFDNEDPLNEGDYLELRMLLVNCMVVIVAYGVVVYCKNNSNKNEQYPYLVGVDYVNMKEQDQELFNQTCSKKTATTNPRTKRKSRLTFLVSQFSF